MFEIFIAFMVVLLLILIAYDERTFRLWVVLILVNILYYLIKIQSVL